MWKSFISVFVCCAAFILVQDGARVQAGKVPTLILASDLNKIESKAGAVAKVFITSKKAGIIDGDFAPAKAAKFILVEKDGKTKKEFTSRTVLSDPKAKAYFKEGTKIRIVLPGNSADFTEIQFGPGAIPGAKIGKEKK